MTRFLSLLFVGSFLLGCGNKEKTPAVQHEATTKYAKHFRLVTHADFTEIQLLQPETGKLERAFALVKKDVKAAVPANMTQITVPVKHMAVLSTTHIGMLDALKATGCIYGSTDAAYVANPAVVKGVRSGKIAAFTDDGSVTPERLLSKDIALIVYSGFGKTFPNEDKLEKLGIVAMANYDWREEHPLGKAEWIKVFGYLTDQPEAAEAYFAEVERSYNETRKAIAKTQHRPKVLVGSLIGDVWYAPAGQSYMAHILRDAGADYLYKNEPGTGSCEKTMEQVFKDQEPVSFWLNAGAVSLPDLLQQNGKYGLFTAVKTGKVYCYTHNSNYFWEMSAVNPHWILDDFATIIGTNPGKKLHFYQQLKP